MSPDYTALRDIAMFAVATVASRSPDYGERDIVGSQSSRVTRADA